MVKKSQRSSDGKRVVPLASGSWMCRCLRSGGKDLRASGAFPRDFGRAIAHLHIAWMEPCRKEHVRWLAQDTGRFEGLPDLRKLVKGEFKAWIPRKHDADAPQSS